MDAEVPAEEAKYWAPLRGVTVLDLTRVLAGPYAGQLLSELGADVIKVESPEGDPARQVGPFVGDQSAYFAALNSGKRGVVLDLRTDAGRDSLNHLLGRADILLENFRPETALQFGCDPGLLRVRHPHLVVVTISSYARDSNRATEGAVDLTVQAECGIMAVTGNSEGPPVRAGVPIGDLAAGMLAVSGAVAGYVERLRTGRGSHVEVPLFDAALSMLSYVATSAVASGTEPGPVGSGHHSIVPYGVYRARDGWVAIAALGDRLWTRTCEALQLTEFQQREDLKHGQGRLLARSEVDLAISGRIAKMSTREVTSSLSRLGVPATPVNGVLAALSNQYAAARNLAQNVGDGSMQYTIVRAPFNPHRELAPAPRLGEHTVAVLKELEAEP